MAGVILHQPVAQPLAKLRFSLRLQIKLIQQRVDQAFYLMRLCFASSQLFDHLVRFF